MDEQKRKAFYHEDFYGQWEILPLTAKHFCLKQMSDINDFSQEHQAENGSFTDVFLREDSPHGIEELGMHQEQLHKALAFLPPYDAVETGYGDYRIEPKATFGRGNGREQNVFWSVNESCVVNAIWLDMDIVPELVDIWRNILMALGKMAPVMLADWGLGLCADLTDTTDIDAYIKEKLDVHEKWLNS